MLVRVLFRPFVGHAAYIPIETIFFFLFIGTLAYSHILNVVKFSFKVAPVHVDIVPFGQRDASPSYFPAVSYRPKSTGKRFTFQIITPTTMTTSLTQGLKSLLTALTDWLAQSLVSLTTNWFMPALKFLFRFASLSRNADPLDILLILLGYLLMYLTFRRLLSHSRSLGSSFFLPLAIISSAVLAFLIALPIAMALNIPIDPVALTEALPFLICTVGFDKPFRLARAVFLHPHLTTPAATSSTLKPAPEIIIESLSYVGTPIIRDYILEVGVFTVGAFSRVGGLREVCALVALTLFIDCLLMCTYFTAILDVMVELRRIRVLKEMKATKIRSNSALLSRPGSSSPSITKPKVKGKENLVGRRKLLLITSFLILHILNFIWPLNTPSKRSDSSPYHLIDQSTTNSVNRKVDIPKAEMRELHVKIHPPIQLSPLLPSTSSSTSSPKSKFFSLPWWFIPSSSPSLPSPIIGDDPILSKCLLAMLALSLVLNRYLLRYIADGSVKNEGRRKRVVRFEDDEEIEKKRRRPQVTGWKMM